LSSRDLLRKLRPAVARAADAAGRRIFPEPRPGDRHWQREMLNLAMEEKIASLGPSGLTAAEISGDGRAGSGWKEFTSLDYPEFDLCAPLEGRGPFDVVICEQVLEHVVDPVAAARNLRGLCRPGGWVLVSTPFLVRIHELPAFGMKDYWRFTPRGLATLLEGAGLEVDTVGSWGNAECVVGNLHRWSALRRWHPMHNEPDLPVQVWAFARNPT
jgi:SAM-dependent methyltransferase